jgi:hypothetical protein
MRMARKKPKQKKTTPIQKIRINSAAGYYY